MARSNEKREARRFGVILAILLGLFAAWAVWRGRPTRATWLTIAALAVVSCTFLLSGVWLAIFRRWMKIVLAISAVTTTLLLGAFFLLALTPFAFFRRLLGKAPLDLGFRDGRASYWIERQGVEPTLERYEKPY